MPAPRCAIVRMNAHDHPLGCSPTTGAGGASDRPYRQAQEWGLPPRITGHRSGSDVLASLPMDEITRKEVVIENDIGWRVETMIDYLFGKSIVVDSAAPDPARRELISELLRLILAHNGGILFLQQLALLGSVYGFVDVLVKLVPYDTPRPLDGACSPRDLGQPPACEEPTSAASAPRGEDLTPPPADPTSRTSAADTTPRAAQLARLAAMVRLEVVEPARALPFLSPSDYRVVDAYAQCLETLSTSGTSSSPPRPKRTWTDHFRRALSHLASVRSVTGGSPDTTITVDLITPTTWRRYENGKVIAQGDNSLGEIPLVHIQNTAVPFEYSGASDVEPLLPLQDELNTRLSDRAGATRSSASTARRSSRSACCTTGCSPLAVEPAWPAPSPARST